MQSSSCRFINHSVRFQAHVCTSVVRARAYVSAAGWTQTLLGIECFHLSLTGLRLGVSTPFPGHLLPAPTVGQSGRSWRPSNGPLMSCDWSTEAGPRKWRLRPENFPKPPHLLYGFLGPTSASNQVSPETPLPSPPSSAHFSRAPAGERFLGFS